MKPSRRAAVAVLAALSMISACGSASNDEAIATEPAASTGSVTPTTSLALSPETVVVITEETAVAPAPDIDPAMQTLVDQAMADLATRRAIDAAGIVAVSAKSVTWPDKSLGCPQPGMAYNQVTVDGALIELTAAGTTYRYHSGGGRSPFLCQKT